MEQRRSFITKVYTAVQLRVILLMSEFTITKLRYRIKELKFLENDKHTCWQITAVIVRWEITWTIITAT